MKRFLFIINMVLVASLLAGLMLCSGCQYKYNPDAFHIFFLDEKKTHLVNMEYDVTADTVEEQVEELLEELSSDTGRVDYVQPIPENLEITKYEVENGFLMLYFNSSYEDMNEVEEVLCRAAIVKTLVQLNEINNIIFFVDNNPLTDFNGNVVGAMNDNSFIDNPGEDIQSIQETELTLYFASEDGKSLVKEVQKVHYNSNVSTEKLIIERLLKTPTSGNSQNAIPTGTQLINISVLDGICVVNFDDGFLNYNFDISEDVVIYSIVDSLTELDTIKAVQISVNGKTNLVYRENMSLAEQYTRDLTLVTEEKEEVEVVDDVAPKGGALNNRIE
ncbi:MAG: GerMN domain-containing protein [Lachnospiraceae bacterium]